MHTAAEFFVGAKLICPLKSVIPCVFVFVCVRGNMSNRGREGRCSVVIFVSFMSSHDTFHDTVCQRGSASFPAAIKPRGLFVNVPG